MDTQNDYTALIGKYLSGEALPEEASKLHQWMQDPDNELEFEKFRKLWTADALTISRLPDKKKAWQSIQQEVHSKARSIRMSSYGIAACLVGLLITAGFFLINRDTNSPNAISSKLKYIKKEAAISTLIDTLEDGTNYTLNKYSSLTFPSTFNDESREVELNGEAYFNVVQSANKPFVIRVGDLLIRVVGTSFNVRHYKKERRVEVQVQTGIVELLSGQNTLRLSKGQTGIYDQQTKYLQLITAIDINALSYATKSFMFVDIPFPQAVSYLEVAFNVSINFDEPSFKDCRITAAFSGKQLDYILNILSVTLNAKYKKKDNVVYFFGKGCK